MCNVVKWISFSSLSKYAIKFGLRDRYVYHVSVGRGLPGEQIGRQIPSSRALQLGATCWSTGPPWGIERTFRHELSHIFTAKYFSSFAVYFSVIVATLLPH